jgi:hypothetical protein
MNPFNDRAWTERTLPKTASDLSESDLESDKPGNKQQSSLFIHKLYGKCVMTGKRLKKATITD